MVDPLDPNRYKGDYRGALAFLLGEYGAVTLQRSTTNDGRVVFAVADEKGVPIGNEWHDSLSDAVFAAWDECRE